MSTQNKDQEAILQKLGIAALNPMQLEAHQAISASGDVLLLSPTGSGKTLAFLLPIIARLDPQLDQVQALIIVPSRELAIQIEQVTREMGSGYKIVSVYGGTSGSRDRMDLKHAPAILIGTPGRVADHLRRQAILTDKIHTLVLDEFDKSLEIGFEKEMREIMEALPAIQQKILTSATHNIEIPDFVGMMHYSSINYLHETSGQLSLKTIISPTDDRLHSLANLLSSLGEKRGIVFCNFKDTIQEVSDFLNAQRIDHGCFYGGLEQMDRERALIKFRNGTNRVLLATDLAARGIDVPELDYIVHFQLPPREEEFTHRNGRTARMNSSGTAYIIRGKQQTMPDFIAGADIIEPEPATAPLKSKWATLFISGGRKDKISKGDIAGLFFKQGALKKDELGSIELQQDNAYVAVPKAKAIQLVRELNNSRLKTKKVRIGLVD